MQASAADGPRCFEPSGLDGMGIGICRLGLFGSTGKRSDDVGWLGDMGPLCLGLHTAEDDQLDKHACRYNTRCFTCLDGLGRCRSKLDGFLRVDSVRCSDRLAVAALHGYCVDVSRAIRIGWIQDDLGNGSIGPRGHMARDFGVDRTDCFSCNGDTANDDCHGNFVRLECRFSRVAIVRCDSIREDIGSSYCAKDAACQSLSFAADLDAYLNLSMGSLSQ